MPEPPSSVELADARSFLVDRIGANCSAVEYVGEGAWSRCFAFERDGHEFVVRFGRQVDDFRRDRFASRFASVDLPIPPVIDIGEAFGAWYCVSTRARGTPWEQLGATEWSATVPSVLATLDALQSADIADTTGFGEWDCDGSAQHATWSSFLGAVVDDPPGRRTHGWRRRLIDSPTSEVSFGRAYSQMMDLAGAFQGPRSLVHNDLLNRNALAVDGRVTAVLDWGCSLYGDFLYELATFVFWSPWHEAIHDSDMLSMAVTHYAAIGLDVADLDARLRCCALHIGLVHLAYNAFLGDLETLRLTDERMSEFLE